MIYCRSGPLAAAAVGGGGSPWQQCCTWKVSFASAHSVDLRSYQNGDRPPLPHLSSTGTQRPLVAAAACKGGRPFRTRNDLDSFKGVGCPVPGHNLAARRRRAGYAGRTRPATPRSILRSSPSIAVRPLTSE